MDEYVPSSDEIPGINLVSPDAFVNPEHLRFAIRGCLAASGCYIIYNSIAWPGISTAVTTCLLTGLSTIGASRQKQILRFAGALVGGFLIGMGSQIFLHEPGQRHGYLHSLFLVHLDAVHRASPFVSPASCVGSSRRFAVLPP